MSDADIQLSIVMPCLNEAETLAVCIRKARQYLQQSGAAGEVIVADNGSTDGSQEIALHDGARLVRAAEKGYGNALMCGIAAAQGRWIVMGDSDDSYDFSCLDPFVEKLREGYDLVMGNRFQGGIRRGAMPFHHQYLGNPLLSGIGRLFFHAQVGDFHCGIRAFRKEAVERMDLRTTGMEFASEMVIKATLLKMKMTEVPTVLYPDGRSRPPHLHSFRDGWRHLRFMLMYSPRWLFLYPGLAFVLVGLAVILWLLPAPREVGGVTFDIHTLLYAVASVIVGYNLIAFSLFAKIFTISQGLLPKDEKVSTFFRFVSLETGLLVGALVTLVGIGGSLYSLLWWESRNFGPLNPSMVMRISIPSVMAFVLGVQTIFSSFMMSILNLKRR